MSKKSQTAKYDYGKISTGIPKGEAEEMPDVA